MGVAPDDDATLDRACDLGMAFQLVNIARDVAEDAAAGRCYLPIDWLVEMDMSPGEHMKPHYRPRLALLVRRMTDMRGAVRGERARAARRRCRCARPGRCWRRRTSMARSGARWRARGEHAWDHRVTTSRAAKLGFVARAGWQAAQPGALYPPVPRDATLWTRPRD